MDAAVVLTIVVAALPPAAVVLAVCGRRSPTFRAHVPVAVAAALTAAAASAAVALMALGRWPADAAVRLVHWLDRESVGVNVALELRLDALSALFAAAISIAVTFAALLSGRAAASSSDERRFSVALALTHASVIGFLLSTNLLVLLFFWQISAVATRWAAESTLADTPGEGPRRLPLAQWAGDALLALGLALVWLHLGTLDLAELPAGVERLQSGGPSAGAAAAILNTIGTCVLFAAAVRCALFPLWSWALESFAWPTPSPVLVQCAIMSLGVGLVARLEPVFAAAPVARDLLLTLGGLGALAASISAVVEREPRRALGLTALALFAMALAGLGTGSAAAAGGAIVLTAVLVLTQGVLLEATSAGDDPLVKRGGRGTPLSCTVIAAVLLTSGICGQHAILAALWPSAGGSHFDVRQSVVLALLAAAHGLTAAAIARALGRARVETAASVQPEGPSAHGTATASWIAIALAAAVAGAWWFAPAGWLELAGRNQSSAFDALILGIVLLLAAVGGAAAFVSSSRSLSVKRAAAESSLVRLARRRFYVEEAFFLGLVLPIRAAAQLCRFLDLVLVNGLFFGALALVPKALQRLMRPIAAAADGLETVGTAGAQFLALAAVLATGVLLIVVLAW
ncbi:MAG: hypothetical protein KY476_05140 [Planctomycetes bacterium]|nr:hypothetical protein [Planctomycetota bacterium]